MDDVTVVCRDRKSVSSLLGICDRFEQASAAKVNHQKSKVIYFGDCKERNHIPFAVKPDYIKVLGICFGSAGGCQKSWEERLGIVRKKLVMWGQRSLSITGKNLVINCEATSTLLYVAHVWPSTRNNTTAVTREVFQTIWGSKMNCVRRDTMDETPEKGEEKGVPNVVLILMATFVCSCLRLCPEPHYASNKCRYLLGFYLFLVLRRVGLAELLETFHTGGACQTTYSFLSSLNTIHKKV